MFHSARIKLTLMYTLIMMIISALFSVITYRALTSELDRVERMHAQRQELLEKMESLARPLGRLRREIDPELINETKRRILVTLGSLNVIIIAAAGAGGYFFIWQDTVTNPENGRGTKEICI